MLEKKLHDVVWQMISDTSDAAQNDEIDACNLHAPICDAAETKTDFTKPLDPKTIILNPTP